MQRRRRGFCSKHHIWLVSLYSHGCYFLFNQWLVYCWKWLKQSETSVQHFGKLHSNSFWIMYLVSSSHKEKSSSANSCPSDGLQWDSWRQVFLFQLLELFLLDFKRRKSVHIIYLLQVTVAKDHRRQRKRQHCWSLPTKQICLMIRATSTRRPCHLQSLQPVVQQRHRLMQAHCARPVGSFAILYLSKIWTEKQSYQLCMEKDFGFPLGNIEKAGWEGNPLCWKVFLLVKLKTKGIKK